MKVHIGGIHNKTDAHAIWYDLTTHRVLKGGWPVQDIFGYNVDSIEEAKVMLAAHYKNTDWTFKEDSRAND